MNFLQCSHTECGHTWAVYFPADGRKDTTIDDCPECLEEEEERSAENWRATLAEDRAKADYYEAKYGI